MKKWIIIALTVASVSFIALNGYLIGKEDSKVQRTVYVENWTRAMENDVIETFETEGIIMPQDEYHIYFHDVDKVFQRFLVKEGDEITAGTPLLEYTTPDLDKLRETIEMEKLQIEGEIEAIDIYISKLENLESSIPPTTSSFEFNPALEEGLNIDENTSSTMIVSAIEQEIYKQELDRSKLEEELIKYDTQLSNIDKQRNSAMMVSEIDGIVKEINEQLGDPVITIVSNVLEIEGQLTESQLKKTEIGMPYSANVAGMQLEGTIGKMNSYPVNEPSLDQDNKYHFEATIDERPESLIIGSKASVSIVTAEANNVLTLQEKAIHNGKNPYVYQLNDNGRISLKPVQTGLKFNGIQEIMEGIKMREVILLSPNDIPKNNAYFVTQMKPTRLKKSALKNLSPHERLEFFLIGLIEK